MFIVLGGFENINKSFQYILIIGQEAHVHQPQNLLKVLKFVKKQCLTYLHNMSVCTNVSLYSQKSLPEVILNW